MSIQDALHLILSEYDNARLEKYSGHILADYLRNSVANSIIEIVGQKYAVKGSAGQGAWAETPWIAIMDPLITRTTQNGFYAVYLFNSSIDRVYLSLNQGVTAVKKEF